MNCTGFRVHCRSVLVFVFSLWTSPSFALINETWEYVKRSQIGIDYSNSIDRVDLSYEMSADNFVPPSCSLLTDGQTKRCSVTMLGGRSNGWGVFLQAPFKRQEFFYFDWDVSVGVRSLSGSLQSREQRLDGLPLSDASFSLLAAVLKPYIQFGVTPEGAPDFLISVGPALQVAMGTMAVNGQSEFVAVGTSSVSGPLSLLQGFFQIEAVVYRFGEGSFSLIASRDSTGRGQGTGIYPTDVDGMSDFKAKFTRDVSGLAFGLGLKLVTPWP